MTLGLPLCGWRSLSSQTLYPHACNALRSFQPRLPHWPPIAHLYPASIRFKSKKAGGHWRQRQRTDPYAAGGIKESQQSAKLRRISLSNQPVGYVSRAAYKLEQLDQRHCFFPPRKNEVPVVVDLGAAPGGWTQVIATVLRRRYLRKRLGRKVNDPRDAQTDQGNNEGAEIPLPSIFDPLRLPIFAIDLLPLHPLVQQLPDVHFIRGDFTQPETQARLSTLIQDTHQNAQTMPRGPKLDMVFSDMMANTMASKIANSVRSLDLVKAAFRFAAEHLRTERHTFFVAKIFTSADADKWRVDVLEKAFHKVKADKLPASRGESKEIFWVCKGFRGIEHIDEAALHQT